MSPALYLTMHKAQGENRVREGGKLVATQHAKYFAALRSGSVRGPAHLFTAKQGSPENVRRACEAAFGHLEWHGSPDIEGMYGYAEVPRDAV